MARINIFVPISTFINGIHYSGTVYVNTLVEDIELAIKNLLSIPSENYNSFYDLLCAMCIGQTAKVWFSGKIYVHGAVIEGTIEIPQDLPSKTF